MILFSNILDAWAWLRGVEVVVADNHGAGVTPVQLFEQLSHGSLLCVGTRVFRLTASIVTALVADADRVGVVVQTVGTDHPFWSAWLYASVTTDDVVVAYTLPVVVLAMPLVYICCRRCLVGAYRTAMNDDQCYYSHFLIFSIAKSAALYQYR